MVAETIFADQDDVAGVIDGVRELEIVGFGAGTVENDVEADGGGFAGSDLADNFGEKRAGDGESVVLADGGFVEIDVEDSDFARGCGVLDWMTRRS